MTEYQTFPYPPRPSELFGEEWQLSVMPLTLNPENWQEIGNLDQELFGKIEPLKKITPEVHTVYSDFFLTELGWRIGVLVYLNPKAKESAVEQWARSQNLPYESENDKRKAGDEFFKKLMEIAVDEERFKEYVKEQGIEVPPPPQDREEVIGWFYSLKDLKEIPRRLRSQLADLTEDWAKEQFFKEFAENGGDINKVSNPFRISRLANPEETLEKIRGYREAKREIKEQERKLVEIEGVKEEKEEDSSLREGERVICQIYRRWLNILLAENYSLRRVLSSYPDSYNFSPEEEELKRLLGIRVKKEEFEGRVAERIDHFLQGVGLRRGEDGLWETIPEILEEYGKRRAEKEEPSETTEYQKYNAFKVTPEQAKKIAEVILKEYGVEDWTVYISPTASSYSVTWKEKGEDVKRINIPEKGLKGLIDTLVVLAHEIEGHVLRNVNAKAIPLRLIQEFPVELAGIFSEAGAMYIEEQTRKAICGMPRPAKPYYLLALIIKRGGGSFKECFTEVLKVRETREREEAKEEQKIDSLRVKFTGKAKRPSYWQKAWGDVLRVFRKHTPLDETSGYLPNSSVLDYLEQELITSALFERGLGKLLAVSGVNPYWLEDLLRLGVVDLEKIKEPQMVVAKIIWPKIKEALDQGKSLEEAIRSL